MTDETVYPATLGARERLVSYAVGLGVGIVIPAVLAVIFALAFSQPGILLFPLPFMLAFGLPYFYRPTAYAVSPREISVIRPLGRKTVSLCQVRAVLSPATDPPGLTIGLARVDGIFGTFGSFWNRAWGRFQVYVTNSANRVELRLREDFRIILSPDDPADFLAGVRNAAAESGLRIEVKG